MNKRTRKEKIESKVYAAQQEMLGAQDAYVNQSLSYLQSLYQRSTDNQKPVLVAELEKAVRSIESIIQETPLVTLDPQLMKSLRKEAKYNQEDLAILFGIKQSTISRLETGKTKKPDMNRKEIREYFLWLKEEGYNPYNL